MSLPNSSPSNPSLGRCVASASLIAVSTAQPRGVLPGLEQHALARGHAVCSEAAARSDAPAPSQLQCRLAAAWLRVIREPRRSPGGRLPAPTLLWARR